MTGRWGWLFAGGGNLGQRTVRSGIWLVLGDGIGRLSGLLKIVVLGRLLLPEDFGLMGIALIVLKWMEYFTETGFRSALIQTGSDVRKYLDTFFTLQAVRGVLIAAALVACAGWAETLFATPGVKPIVQAVGAVVLLRGLVNPAVVHLRRELDVRREVVWRSGSALVGLLVAIPVAWARRDATALVASVIATQAAETIGSYYLFSYRPRFAIDAARAREMASFGRWIFGLNVLVFFAVYVDSVAVGRLLGATALGFYQVAQQVAFLPTSQLGVHVHGVMFPALSRIGEASALRDAWLRANRALSAAVVPAALFITLFAEPIVSLILGKTWLPAVPPLRVLVWAGVAFALTKLTSALLQGVGRPDLTMRAAVVEVVTLGVLLYPMVLERGLVGAAATVVAARGFSLIYQLAVALPMVGAAALSWVRSLQLGILASLPVAAVGILVPLGSRWAPVAAIAAAGVSVALVAARLGPEAILLGREPASTLGAKAR